MSNEKLEEIGDKLNVSSQEIKDIRKRNLRNRILYIITSALIAVIAFILGFFAGRLSCPTGGGGGYPFSSALFAPAVITDQKPNSKSKIAILLMGGIGFLLAFKMSPVFGQAIDYGVYETCKNRARQEQ